MTTTKKLFLLLFVAVMASCNKTAPIIMSKEVWIVHLYTENGKDETSDLAGYEFDFDKSGTFKATFSGTTESGTWTYTDSGKKMTLDISGTAKLDKIKGNWIVTAQSSTMIELADDNPNSNEVLHFQKK